MPVVLDAPFPLSLLIPKGCVPAHSGTPPSLNALLAREARGSRGIGNRRVRLAGVHDLREEVRWVLWVWHVKDGEFAVRDALVETPV